MITLPRSPQPPTNSNPRLLLLYGASKVGKTHSLGKLDDLLIIDTEKGTRAIPGMKVEVNNLKELGDLIKELKKPENKGIYKYIALDTLDNLVRWIEKHVCVANLTKDGTPHKSVADLPFGSGWSQVREKTLEVVKSLTDLADGVILIAHRDRRVVGENQIEVSIVGLDLPGKGLKNELVATADAIGHVYRDKQGNLRISFIRAEGKEEVEAGSRIPHLENRDIEFDWSLIYKED